MCFSVFTESTITYQSYKTHTSSIWHTYQELLRKTKNSLDRSFPERISVRFKWIKQSLCFPNISFLTTSYHIIGLLGKRSFLYPSSVSLSDEGSTLELNHYEEFKDGTVLRIDLMELLINSIALQITLAH